MLKIGKLSSDGIGFTESIDWLKGGGGGESPPDAAATRLSCSYVLRLTSLIIYGDPPLLLHLFEHHRSVHFICFRHVAARLIKQFKIHVDDIAFKTIELCLVGD